MLRYIRHLAGSLVLLTAGGCAATDGPMPEPESGTAPCSISIAVNGAGPTTRTAVVDPDGNLRGKQHVTRVQLYILRKTDEGFRLVASEDVEWNQDLKDALITGTSTRQQKYTTRFQDYEDEAEYMLLAVGFDDEFEGDSTDLTNIEWKGTNSVAAFGLPKDLIPENGLLSEHDRFILKESAGVSVLNHSEVFAGSRTFTGAYIKQGRFKPEDTLELYRRVAGVAGYFRNIPSTINDKNVAAIAIRTCTGQNTQAYFLPNLPDGYTSTDAVPDADYIDHITSPGNEENGDIISRYDINDDSDGNDMITLSAFLLPMAASADAGSSTLRLELLDKDGTPLSSRRILYSATRSGTGIIDEEDDGTSDNPAMHYPIRANHFYRIGDSSHPIDLSGSTGYIIIEIDPIWDEYYGGSLDNDNYPSGGNESDQNRPNVGIDNAWGEHEGGALDRQNDSK